MRFLPDYGLHVSNIGCNSTCVTPYPTPAPTAVVTAPQWGAAAARNASAAAGTLADKGKKGYDAAKEYAIRNPGWVANWLEFADDLVNQSGPGNTLLGQGVNAVRTANNQYEDGAWKSDDTIKEEKIENKDQHSLWWGR